MRTGEKPPTSSDPSCILQIVCGVIGAPYDHALNLAAGGTDIAMEPSQSALEQCINALTAAPWYVTWLMPPLAVVGALILAGMVISVLRGFGGPLFFFGGIVVGAALLLLPVGWLIMSWTVSGADQALAEDTCRAQLAPPLPPAPTPPPEPAPAPDPAPPPSFTGSRIYIFARSDNAAQAQAFMAAMKPLGVEVTYTVTTLDSVNVDVPRGTVRTVYSSDADPKFVDYVYRTLTKQIDSKLVSQPRGPVQIHWGPVQVQFF